MIHINDLKIYSIISITFIKGIKSFQVSAFNILMISENRQIIEYLTAINKYISYEFNFGFKTLLMLVKIYDIAEESGFIAELIII